MSEAPLVFARQAFAEMLGHAYDGYPLEACGLLVGRGSNVIRFVACRNVAGSARVYTIDPKEHLHAEIAAESDGLEVIGVFHSHTHSEPYPSHPMWRRHPIPGGST